MVLEDLNNGKETIAYGEETTPIVENTEIESIVSDFEDKDKQGTKRKDYDLERNGKNGYQVCTQDKR